MQQYSYFVTLICQHYFDQSELTDDLIETQKYYGLVCVYKYT